VLKIDIAASRGGQRKLIYLMHFSWPLLEAALPVSTFCLLLKLGRKLLFLIYLVLIILCTPKEMTKNRALARTVCNVY